MIRSATEMKEFDILATDGQVGSLDDVYFDDERWAIRYVVVDTGGWLPGRRVLISPLSVTRTEWNEQRILLSISRDQVRDSPDIDLHQPVSRRQERDYFDYFAYPYYWDHAGLWGAHTIPILATREQIAAQRRRAEAEREAADRDDTHLRSASEVSGYVIRALDGDIGHADDLLFDDASWVIRYIVADTSNWWFGHHVLVSPDWITDISWPEHAIFAHITGQLLKTAPPYDRADQVDRQWETAYYQHLELIGYWLTKDEAQARMDAQSYRRDQTDRHGAALERRWRPR